MIHNNENVFLQIFSQQFFFSSKTLPLFSVTPRRALVSCSPVGKPPGFLIFWLRAAQSARPAWQPPSPDTFCLGLTCHFPAARTRKASRPASLTRADRPPEFGYFSGNMPRYHLLAHTEMQLERFPSIRSPHRLQVTAQAHCKPANRRTSQPVDFFRRLCFS